MIVPETYWQLSEEIRVLLRWLNSNPNNGFAWRQKYNEWKALVDKQNRLVDQLQGKYSVTE